MAACSTATFEFDSAKGGKAGQQGAIPQLGFGSATLFDDPCRDSIRAAVKAGYRHIDTAEGYALRRRDPFTGGGLCTATIPVPVSRKKYLGRFTETLGNFTQPCAKFPEASGNLDERKMNEQYSRTLCFWTWFIHCSFIKASRSLQKMFASFRKHP